MSLLGNSVLYHLETHTPSSLFITCFGVLSNLHSWLKSDALKMMMDQQLCHSTTDRDWEPVDRLPSASSGNLAGQLSNHKFPRSHRGSFDLVQDAMTTLSQYWKDCIWKRHSTTLAENHRLLVAYMWRSDICCKARQGIAYSPVVPCCLKTEECEPQTAGIPGDDTLTWGFHANILVLGPTREAVMSRTLPDLYCSSPQPLTLKCIHFFHKFNSLGHFIYD